MTEVAAFTPEQEHDRAVRSRRMITYLLMFAIVMFFAGLTSAYVVSKGSAVYWVAIQFPSAFYISTAFILLGSLAIQSAYMAAKAGKQGLIAPLLALTLVLGVGFAYYQVEGWAQLRNLGNFFSFSNVLQPTGEYGADYWIEANGTPLLKEGSEYFHPDDVAHAKPLNADMAEQVNGASQYFYMLTWAHFGHVAFGFISLLVMLVMALMRRYTPRDNVGLWAGAVYWHFLGGLWVYLLLFLMFFH